MDGHASTVKLIETAASLKTMMDFVPPNSDKIYGQYGDHIKP